MWTAGAVARRLAVAPATLRSWNQRYQLGRHRRFTEQDVAVLETMCRLIGTASSPPRPPASPAPPARPTPPELADPAAQHLAGHRAVDPHAGVDGDGGAAEHLVRGWVQAALWLDARQTSGSPPRSQRPTAIDL